MQGHNKSCRGASLVIGGMQRINSLIGCAGSTFNSHVSFNFPALNHFALSPHSLFHLRLTSSDYLESPPLIVAIRKSSPQAVS
jgi:hypothetical protein